MMIGVLGTVLGGGAGMTVVLGVYDRIRNRKFDKDKQRTTIKLDEAQYDEIASRAQQTNSSSLMAVGAFWQGQFTELEKKFAAEQLWRRRMTDRMHEHRRWDNKLLEALQDCDMHVEPPPSLDPDED